MCTTNPPARSPEPPAVLVHFFSALFLAVTASGVPKREAVDAIGFL